MKERKINYNVSFWGPLLFKTVLSNEDVKSLLSICNKNTSHHKRLAGVIKEEYTLNNVSFGNIVRPYLEVFMEAYNEYYNIKHSTDIYIKQCWVNYMKAGDSNPTHIHNNCNWSSVLYLNVPKKIIDEQNNFEGTGGGPGSISFICGPHNDNFINQKDFRPRTGDFFIFPATLPHNVPSYKSNCTRISCAANFTLQEV